MYITDEDIYNGIQDLDEDDPFYCSICENLVCLEDLCDQGEFFMCPVCGWLNRNE